MPLALGSMLEPFPSYQSKIYEAWAATIHLLMVVVLSYFQHCTQAFHFFNDPSHPYSPLFANSDLFFFREMKCKNSNP